MGDLHGNIPCYGPSGILETAVVAKNHRRRNWAEEGAGWIPSVTGNCSVAGVLAGSHCCRRDYVIVDATELWVTNVHVGGDCACLLRPKQAPTGTGFESTSILHRNMTPEYEVEEDGRYSNVEKVAVALNILRLRNGESNASENGIGCGGGVLPSAGTIPEDWAVPIYGTLVYLQDTPVGDDDIHDIPDNLEDVDWIDTLTVRTCDVQEGVVCHYLEAANVVLAEQQSEMVPAAVGET